MYRRVVLVRIVCDSGVQEAMTVVSFRRVY
jgi:hypothetical protein